VRLLLDTHIALWSIAAPNQLPTRARPFIEDPGNDLFVSVVSVWEIAIKHALSQRRIGRMPVSAKMAFEHFASAGFKILDITAGHALAVEALPALHGDPFDRMLIAQARAEPMRLLSADAKMAAYGEVVLAV
jgi:PIN domain nuclease of toxin-antitoxin system